MDLNSAKYSIKLARSKNSMYFQHKLFDFNISVVTRVKDLRTIIDSNLTFIGHSAHVTATSSRMLGFIKRSRGHFSSPCTLIRLYSSLVLPHLDYTSVIWQFRIARQSDQLERIRNFFLGFLACKSACPLNVRDRDSYHGEIEILSTCN